MAPFFAAGKSDSMKWSRMDQSIEECLCVERGGGLESFGRKTKIHRYKERNGRGVGSFAGRN